MSSNNNLNLAKQTKNDEFYTQYQDIQKEINAYLEYNPNTFKDKTVLCPCDDPEWSNFTKFFAQNFELLGLKKLISTSYARSKKEELYKIPFNNISEIELNSSQYDSKISKTNGKVYILDHNLGKEEVDINDLQWFYLQGDGDFRSEEVKRLCNEADIIVTNPPFSLFRQFIDWLINNHKQFLSIGNSNTITDKNIFPLIKNNTIWFGCSHPQIFLQPNGIEKKFGNIAWFTNLDHGRRHQPLQLMTMEDNLKFSKHKIIKEKGYIKYDNYNAIEIPYIDAIPSDYDGIMGVPISFLDKYNPTQFEILGASEQCGKGFSNGLWDSKSKIAHPLVNGEKKYSRLFIQRID